MYRLEFLNNWGSASSAALSERTDYLLMGLLMERQNDAELFGKYAPYYPANILRIIEISHLNI